MAERETRKFIDKLKHPFRHSRKSSTSSDNKNSETGNVNTNSEDFQAQRYSEVDHDTGERVESGENAMREDARRDDANTTMQSQSSSKYSPSKKGRVVSSHNEHINIPGIEIPSDQYASMSGGYEQGGSGRKSDALMEEQPILEDVHGEQVKKSGISQPKVSEEYYDANAEVKGTRDNHREYKQGTGDTAFNVDKRGAESAEGTEDNSGLGSGIGAGAGTGVVGGAAAAAAAAAAALGYNKNSSKSDKQYNNPADEKEIPSNASVKDANFAGGSASVTDSNDKTAANYTNKDDKFAKNDYERGTSSAGKNDKQVMSDYKGSKLDPSGGYQKEAMGNDTMGGFKTDPGYDNGYHHDMSGEVSYYDTVNDDSKKNAAGTSSADYGYQKGNMTKGDDFNTAGDFQKEAADTSKINTEQDYSKNTMGTVGGTSADFNTGENFQKKTAGMGSDNSYKDFNYKEEVEKLNKNIGQTQDKIKKSGLVDESSLNPSCIKDSTQKGNDKDMMKPTDSSNKTGDESSMGMGLSAGVAAGVAAGAAAYASKSKGGDSESQKDNTKDSTKESEMESGPSKGNTSTFGNVISTAAGALGFKHTSKSSDTSKENKVTSGTTGSKMEDSTYTGTIPATHADAKEVLDYENAATKNKAGNWESSAPMSGSHFKDTIPGTEDSGKENFSGKNVNSKSRMEGLSHKDIISGSKSQDYEGSKSNYSDMQGMQGEYSGLDKNLKSKSTGEMHPTKGQNSMEGYNATEVSSMGQMNKSDSKYGSVVGEDYKHLDRGGNDTYDTMKHKNFMESGNEGSNISDMNKGNDLGDIPKDSYNTAMDKSGNDTAEMSDMLRSKDVDSMRDTVKNAGSKSKKADSSVGDSNYRQDISNLESQGIQRNATQDTPQNVTMGTKADHNEKGTMGMEGNTSPSSQKSHSRNMFGLMHRKQSHDKTSKDSSATPHKDHTDKSKDLDNDHTESDHKKSASSKQKMMMGGGIAAATGAASRWMNKGHKDAKESKHKDSKDASNMRKKSDAEGKFTVEVIGTSDKNSAKELAVDTTNKLSEEGVDLSDGILVINTNTKEVYKTSETGDKTFSEKLPLGLKTSKLASHGTDDSHVKSSTTGKTMDPYGGPSTYQDDTHVHAGTGSSVPRGISHGETPEVSHFTKAPDTLSASQPQRRKSESNYEGRIDIPSYASQIQNATFGKNYVTGTGERRSSFGADSSNAPEPQKQAEKAHTPKLPGSFVA